jgi:uncharacterized membrane protein
MSNSISPSQRNIADGNLSKSKALPAAAATAYTDSIDLSVAGNLAAVEGAEVRVTVPATPSLADNKAITLTVQDSADDSSFTAVSELAAQTITGVATSQGGEASEFRFKLPSSVRRYIRCAAAVESGGGSNIAVEFTLDLLT